MAAADGDDDLFYLRLTRGELLGYPLNSRRPSEVMRQIGGHLVTDAKNLFDKLNTPILTVKGAEKRSDIEALSLRENLERFQTTISWVHGDATIANSLTKVQEKHQMLLYVQMGHRWKVLYDEKMQSARARKRQGMQAMESEEPCEQYNNTTYQRLHPSIPFQRELLPHGNHLTNRVCEQDSSKP